MDRQNYLLIFENAFDKVFACQIIKVVRKERGDERRADGHLTIQQIMTHTQLLHLHEHGLLTNRKNNNNNNNNNNNKNNNDNDDDNDDNNNNNNNNDNNNLRLIF